MISLVSNNASPTTADASAKDQAKLKSAAQAFEAVFLRQMIGSMRSAKIDDGLFDSSATDQFQDMADAKSADSMASKGVLGIAEMLTKQLSHVVTAQSGSTASATGDGATAAAS